MEKEEKKKEERNILEKIFGSKIKVVPREEPNFKIFIKGNYIGVEITKLYFDETSARIKQKNYIQKIFSEKNY